MAYRDGTGPQGQGAMTGRGMGFCTGNARVMHGRGMGMGRGMGFRHGSGMGLSQPNQQMLQIQKARLEAELKSIEAQLAEK